MRQNVVILVRKPVFSLVCRWKMYLYTAGHL